MLKRLLAVFMALITLPLIPVEIVVYGIRWIVTAKSFPTEPLFVSFLFH